MARLVLGVFSLRGNAEDAIAKLENSGYNPKDISIMMKDKREARDIADSTGASVVGGAVSGAATGGILGALAGLLVATGVIPGLGAILIGGPLAAALGLTGTAATAVSGAATGVIAGGIIGALASLGLSDEDARAYEESIREGGILLAVPARLGEEDEVSLIMERCGAIQIKSIDASDSYSRTEEDYVGQYKPAYFSEVKPRRRRGR